MTIGQFGEETRLRPKALRLYDQLGLSSVHREPGRAGPAGGPSPLSRYASGRHRLGPPNAGTGGGPGHGQKEESVASPDPWDGGL